MSSPRLGRPEARRWHRSRCRREFAIGRAKKSRRSLSISPALTWQQSMVDSIGVRYFVFCTSVTCGKVVNTADLQDHGKVREKWKKKQYKKKQKQTQGLDRFTVAIASLIDDRIGSKDVVMEKRFSGTFPMCSVRRFSLGFRSSSFSVNEDNSAEWVNESTFSNKSASYFRIIIFPRLERKRSSSEYVF